MKSEPLEDEVEDILEEFLDCAKYDVLMEGCVFMGWNRSALDKMRRKYEKGRINIKNEYPSNS